MAAAAVSPFGPITDNNLDWKLQFWPDKKNILQRKCRRCWKVVNPFRPRLWRRQVWLCRALGAQEWLLFDEAFASAQAFSPATSAKLLIASSQLTASDDCAAC
ncbi:MAG: hypothetical protein R3F38_12490 [Gammaproteobacteria bacterium]